jgi:hypothetical protein
MKTQSQLKVKSFFYVLLLSVLSIAILYSCREESESLAPDFEGTVDLSDTRTTNEFPFAPELDTTAWSERIGAPIAKSIAEEWIKNYRSVNPEGVFSHYFGRDSFRRLFSNPNCMGVTVNYALDGNGRQQLILVGVDGNGNILADPSQTALQSDFSNSYEDASRPCPPFCPK